ncbi:MAG: Lar family restriction alleviation protein [Bacteroidales bacterium]|jgi:Lar family restriction alleviation protein
MTNLLPCPFCGTTDDLEHIFIDTESMSPEVEAKIICRECDFHLHEYGKTNEEAEEKVMVSWNTRQLTQFEKLNKQEAERTIEIEKLKLEVQRLNKIIDKLIES